jgi:hypothetical protein
MRTPSLRPIAVLALTGAIVGGVLSGCGKGGSSQRAAGGGAQIGTAPATQGVVGISTKNTTRLGGAEPADDAAAVAQAVFAGFTAATRPQAVVVVDEHHRASARAAAALAGAPLGAPIHKAGRG